MTSIDSRIRKLGLPLDQMIICGSGIMDALGLRESRDIDFIASDELFRELVASGEYEFSIRDGDEVCTSDGIEAWRTWFGDSFGDLKPETVVIDDVRYLSVESTIGWKRALNRPKDIVDIKLLEEYNDR